MLPIAILAGGLATRIRPISELIPKSLVIINQKPFLEWQLQLLEKNGCETVVICVSHKSEMIERFIQDRAKSNLEIHLSHDGKQQLGTGGALIKARKILGNAFMVLYGDSYLPVNYGDISDHFLNSGKLSLMVVLENDLNHERSNVFFENGYVKKYDKWNPEKSMNFIDFGLSAFKSDAFNNYPPNKFVELSLIQADLATRNHMIGFQVYQRYYEVGSFQGIKDFQNFMEGDL